MAGSFAAGYSVTVIRQRMLTDTPEIADDSKVRCFWKVYSQKLPIGNGSTHRHSAQAGADPSLSPLHDHISFLVLLHHQPSNLTRCTPLGSSVGVLGKESRVEAVEEFVERLLSEL